MNNDEINVQKHYKSFTPVNNTPLRNMKDLNAIGMITYLVSHTEKFKITKGGLYTRFGRCAATKSLKRLEKEGFFLSFKLRNGSRVAYRYFASDIPFTEEQVLTIAEQLIEKEGFLRIDDLPGCFSYLFSKEEQCFSQTAFVAAKERHMKESAQVKEQSSSAGNEQWTNNSSESAVENEQVKKTKDLKKTKSKKTNSKKTTTSSPVTKNREVIKKELGDEFGHELVATLEQELLADQSVSIKTNKQFDALMRYRLNFKKQTQQKKAPTSEAFAGWLSSEKEKQKAYEEREKQAREEEFALLTQEDFDMMLRDVGVKVHATA